MANPRGTKCKFCDIEMIDLFVGKEKTEIQIHQNILFDASPVFKAALDTQLKESTERSMSLPDDDADIIDAIIQYLYFPTLTLPKKHKVGPPMPAVTFAYVNTLPKAPIRRLLSAWHAWNVDSEWFESCHSWILGLPEFAVDVCIALYKGLESVPNPFEAKTADSYLEKEPVVSVPVVEID
ncbi:hypothetical protein OEA41_008555 [Lepraria neglecta]|uniref:BTB domain-containing protein n=1 Tax=Lepraria neglecta TaxID=209136 RepID=A0AAD9ZEN4_9LECA|nr:hypothetical protein OEA41_008555 [Lepraria neglecta]